MFYKRHKHQYSVLTVNKCSIQCIACFDLCIDSVDKTKCHTQYHCFLCIDCLDMPFTVHTTDKVTMGGFQSPTLTGSAMANWNRRLLIQGVTTFIVASIPALGHCFGESGYIMGSRSQGHRKQTRFVSGWNSGLFRSGQVFTQEGVRVCHKQALHHWYIFKMQHQHSQDHMNYIASGCIQATHLSVHQTP